jgi:hypothetical protein
MELSAAAFSRMRGALAGLRDALAEYAQSQGPSPLPGSKGEAEVRAFRRPESVHTAQSQAWILLEVAADQLTAFVKTISEPVETIAPYTCVRSLLEASALASWLLDERIDAERRVSRSLALRIEGLQQQVKWASAAGLDVAPGKQRIQAAVDAAVEIGFTPIHDAKGRPIGVGERMPSITSLIGIVFDEEALYRLLSAVAHGHAWALQQLSFHRAPSLDTVSSSGERLAGLTKGASASGFLLSILTAAQVFSRSVWDQATYLGWDTRRLSSILDGAFDSLGASDEVRFWRVAT